jgi:hypothetical protein
MDCKSLAFSKDGINFEPPVTLNVTRFATSNEAPGAVAVPGALVITHVGANGSHVPVRGENVGMDLLYTTDGKNWNLFKKLWPLQGGYSTAAGFGGDEDTTGATSIGVLYEAGILEGREYIIFQNFTWEMPSTAGKEASVLV